MMMRFNEGEALSAMFEELHALTGCDNVHGLPHFLPSLPQGPDSDHGPIIATPLTRYSEENRPVEIEGELESVQQLFGHLVSIPRQAPAALPHSHWPKRGSKTPDRSMQTSPKH